MILGWKVISRWGLFGVVVRAQDSLARNSCLIPLSAYSLLLA